MYCDRIGFGLVSLYTKKTCNSLAGGVDVVRIPVVVFQWQ